MESQNIIIIAGMHRSGTSLTASLLERSGLKIGENLMSNGFDNEKGHFEDLELLKIHESDLKAKSLDTRGLSGNIKSHLDFEQSTLADIKNMMKSKKHLSLWGWKEPRTTLYLHAWKTNFPNVKCIAVFRHYDEVANSLLKRYQHKLLKGVNMTPLVRIKHFVIYPLHIFILKHNAYKCWYVYNKAILDFKKDYPDDTIVLELNHFITNYNAILNTINAQFNTDLSKIRVEDVLETSLLSNREDNTLKIRVFSHKKLRELIKLMNQSSLWI